MQRRFSKGLQAQFSYTYSKALDDDPGNEIGGAQTKYWRDHHADKGYSPYDFRNALRVSYSYDLPFGPGKAGLAGHLLSGWQLSGVVSAHSGQPFAVTASVPTALSNLQVSRRSPNLVSGYPYSKIIRGGPDLYFDPQAFSAPGARELGNVGRDTLAGPGLAKWDFGLTKNTSLSERWRVQFRAETFNLLNRAQFASPSSSVFSGSGGRQGSAGVITSTVDTSRQIQFGLKLLF